MKAIQNHLKTPSLKNGKNGAGRPGDDVELSCPDLVRTLRIRSSMSIEYWEGEIGRFRQPLQTYIKRTTEDGFSPWEMGLARPFFDDNAGGGPI
jgi:hypothetical protein